MWSSKYAFIALCALTFAFSATGERVGEPIPFTNLTIVRTSGANNSDELMPLATPVPMCYVHRGVDVLNHDIGNVRGSADYCCDICKTWTGCFAYTWTNYNGGTCWLKSSVALQARFYINPGAVTGVVLPSFPLNPGEGVAITSPAVGYDMPMHDIRRAISPQGRSGCSAQCDADLFADPLKTCSAYAYVEADKMCYFKWASSTLVPKAGVTSAILFRRFR